MFTNVIFCKYTNNFEYERNLSRINTELYRTSAAASGSEPPPKSAAESVGGAGVRAVASRPRRPRRGGGRTRQRTLGGGRRHGGRAQPAPHGGGWDSAGKSAGREKESTTDTGDVGGRRGVCQFDPRNTLRGLRRTRRGRQCYKCEIQVVTFVNLVVTIVNGLAKGITNVNGITQKHRQPPRRRRGATHKRRQGQGMPRQRHKRRQEQGMRRGLERRAAAGGLAGLFLYLELPQLFHY